MDSALQRTASCNQFAVTYNGKVAGSIGCVPKTDVYRKSIEIGYFIGEQFKGNGIATEAVRILLEYVQHRFDVVRIYAEVFANNKASMRVLEKNGFYLEAIHRRSVVKNNVLMDDYIWVKF
jgi:RimJ/RimL family protein N-acetyltransferase